MEGLFSPPHTFGRQVVLTSSMPKTAVNSAVIWKAHFLPMMSTAKPQKKLQNRTVSACPASTPA